MSQSVWEHALLDIGDGEPKVLWMNRDMCGEIGSPVMVDGYIYACQGVPEKRPGNPRCLDTAKGKMLWEELLNKRPISLAAADWKFVILDDRGKIYCRNYGGDLICVNVGR